MASTGTTTSYIGSSTSSYSGTLGATNASVAKVSPIKTVQTSPASNPVQPARTLTHGDTVDLSQLSKLVGQIDLQLQGVSSSEFNHVLSSAANNVWAQAQQEGDSAQAAALENLASRLQVAANSSGLSLLPPFFIASLLG